MHGLQEKGIGVRSLADPRSINTADDSMGRIAVLLHQMWCDHAAESISEVRMSVSWVRTGPRPCITTGHGKPPGC